MQPLDWLRCDKRVFWNLATVHAPTDFQANCCPLRPVVAFAVLEAFSAPRGEKPLNQAWKPLLT